MARLHSGVAPFAANDFQPTQAAPVVHSEVDIAVYPHRWTVQPRTVAHKAAVQRHGRAADSVIVRMGGAVLAAWLLFNVLQRVWA